MFDREFHIRFTLADVGKLLCFSPVVVVLIYGLISLPWESDNAPSWVQAIGSVVAILTAVGVAAADRTAQERRRQADEERIALAHEKRLWCLIWECEYLAQQLKDQVSSSPAIRPGEETVALFNRLLDRAVMNFDDDLDVWRLETVRSCRYLIGTYIHLCMQRIAKTDKEGEFVKTTADFHRQVAAMLTKSEARLQRLQGKT